MNAILKRLHRLEQRFELAERRESAVESREALRLQARLNASRLRMGLPPPSPERQAELRGMSLVEILNSSRRRAE